MLSPKALAIEEAANQLRKLLARDDLTDEDRIRVQQAVLQLAHCDLDELTDGYFLNDQRDGEQNHRHG
jgi:hypothetical protein